MPLRSSPFAWFIALLLGAELIALWLGSFQPLDVDGYRRNDTPLRHWPEYTRCEDRDPERPLAVLVGASQSVSPEFADSGSTWVAMVQRRLADEGVDVDLRNWSVSGIRSDQLELLTLQAVRCGARAVIYALSLANIDERFDFRFDSHSADVDLLAGDPRLWWYLPGSLTFEQATYDQLAKRFLRSQFALGRARDQALDLVASRAGHRLTYYLTGHARPMHARMRLGERGAVDAAGLNLGFAIGDDVTIDPVYWDHQIESQRMPVFDAIYRNIHARFRADGVALTWLFSAVNVDGRANDILDVSEKFHRRICTRLQADGWPCHDLSRALATDDFFPAGIGSHFNRQGQERFAQLVYPFIRDAVH